MTGIGLEGGTIHRRSCQAAVDVVAHGVGLVVIDRTTTQRETGRAVGCRLIPPSLVNIDTAAVGSGTVPGNGAG